MYVAAKCIPAVNITSLAAIVSHDPSDYRISRFPVIWCRNPTWLFYTVLIIASDMHQGSDPNIRNTCITAL